MKFLAPAEFLIEGTGEDGFRFNTTAGWQVADMIIDNGLRNGYTIYRQGAIIGCGNLLVFDEIDQESEILDGGPLPPGWVTNFPIGFISPPLHVKRRYQTRKRLFRADFITWPLIVCPEAENVIASSVGRRVYKLAAIDPSGRYGLRDTQKTSGTRFCVGFDGTKYHYPTLSSSINYYYQMYPGQDVFSHLVPLAAADEARTISADDDFDEEPTPGEEYELPCDHAQQRCHGSCQERY
ncbi:hypothetical protein SAMD00023353_0104050 [Rosellinia necatrix]|uniref:Uncharacterized protein n=1 Tax=Rosellinia necatrix TaxID=77044 RepID=A0A1S8A4Y6_ROSNE|nr:hypothetical protein SAMD00023353_0104050 [Rosellinia necatrix]